MADTTSKVVQVDWLDYWFKPRLKIVSYGDFVATVKELESQQARVFSVEVDKANGRYKIHYAPSNESLAQQRETEAKGKAR